VTEGLCRRETRPGGWRNASARGGRVGGGRGGGRVVLDDVATDAGQAGPRVLLPLSRSRSRPPPHPLPFRSCSHACNPPSPPLPRALPCGQEVAREKLELLAQKSHDAAELEAARPSIFADLLIPVAERWSGSLRVLAWSMCGLVIGSLSLGTLALFEMRNLRSRPPPVPSAQRRGAATQHLLPVRDVRSGGPAASKSPTKTSSCRLQVWAAQPLALPPSPSPRLRPTPRLTKQHVLLKTRAL
jgi:hypothetical protein